MRVMGNRVLVKRINQTQLKSKYLEIIQSDREPGQFALVAAVGPGKQMQNGNYIPIEVRAGDVVILAKYSGAPVTLKNPDGSTQDYHLVDGDDVLAVAKR